MRPELILSQRPELRLQLSPQLIQRIEILQLGAADLEDLVENELLSNELLEAKPSIRERSFESQLKDQKADEEAAENGAVESDSRARLDRFTQTTFDIPRRRKRSSDEVDSKLEALQNTPTRPKTLAEHLESQLTLEEADPNIVRLARFLVLNLDHNGWLNDPLDELRIPFAERCSHEDLEKALCLVQSLDPTGVGARDPVECLLLQLDPRHPRAEQLRQLITHFLEDLARNRLPKIAHDMGTSVEDVKDLAAILRHEFNPFPGRAFEHVPPTRVRPDVVVEKIEGHYELRLEDDYLPQLRVNEVSLKSLKNGQADPELRRHLRRDLEAARWLIESIEQRKRTLQRVAMEIVRRQKDFLDQGVNYLRPLKMQEIADELGIHVSTVSRALKGKYVQTPQGIHEMKFFFTGASRGTDGVVESRTGVRERVREIIDKEEKSHPLSDEEIVDLLKATGLEIARRTVTKYRKAMKIPSSRQRRAY